MHNSNSEAATTSSVHQPQPKQEAFTFKLIKPFSNPDAPKAKFLIEGLLTQGGLAALVAKPKHSKSSISRYAAVCVAKGKPFLGRDTQQGKVLLISIEDSPTHIENCLNVLGYDANEDEPIHIVESVSSDTQENVNALRHALTNNPGIRLVVIDTFAKFGRVKDMNEYAPWLKVFGPLKELRLEFPQVSILCLLHAKKTTSDDVFDSMLGSSALRGEFDSNIAIYDESGKRLIITECRMGRPLAPTILKADVVTSDGCDVVADFRLDGDFAEWSKQKKNSAEDRRKASIQERIITYLTENNDRALYSFIIEDVTGNATKKKDAVADLVQKGVLAESGLKNSPMDPYTLTLNRDELGLYDFISKFANKKKENNENHPQHD